MVEKEKEEEYVPGVSKKIDDDISDSAVNNPDTARCRACGRDIGAFVQLVEDDSQGRRRITSLVDESERANPATHNGITPIAIIVCQNCMLAWKNRLPKSK